MNEFTLEDFQLGDSLFPSPLEFVDVFEYFSDPTDLSFYDTSDVHLPLDNGDITALAEQTPYSDSPNANSTSQTTTPNTTASAPECYGTLVCLDCADKPHFARRHLYK